MFPRLPARATFVADTNLVSGTQKRFLILFWNILCPQQMFPSLRSPRNIMGNNVSATIRELKNLRRRRRGQRRFKNEFIFTCESRGTLKSFTLFISVKTITELNLGRMDISELKMQKISRRGSRSPDNTELGHFTFLFCRGRQRNVQRIISHVHSYCSAH